MNKLPVLKYPNKCLKEFSQQIKFPLEPYIQDLIEQMRKTIRFHKALGLAANQVGHAINLFIAQNRVFINPLIIYHGEIINSNEGCLSIPGKRFNVKRYSEIDLVYNDVNGTEKTEWYIKGELAIICQHEYDHLKGKLINGK